MNYLQPYKGKSTRHSCPACETKQSFTLYIDGETHEPIHRTVGKCNRESKCGYHYTPKQYFIDNPTSLTPLRQPTEGRVGSVCPSSCTDALPSVSKKTPFKSDLVGTVPFSFVQKSSSYKSNFVRFLFEHFSDEQIRNTAENYALGATKNKEVIFWQIDIMGKVRTGKIMQYNPATGKRIKHKSGAIDWVHNKLKQKKQLSDDFNLQQCFFGEHLLKIYPEKLVAIVESEKSAIIASMIMPELVWLAAGNLNGLSVEKCQAVKGREVILYPDLGAFEKWSLKATEIQKQYNCKVNVSTLLEDEAMDIDRANGLDIADFIITELKSKKTTLDIQSFFSPTLQLMIEQNKALLILISGLQLDEA